MIISMFVFFNIHDKKLTTCILVDIFINFIYLYIIMLFGTHKASENRIIFPGSPWDVSSHPPTNQDYYVFNRGPLSTFICHWNPGRGGCPPQGTRKLFVGTTLNWLVVCIGLFILSYFLTHKLQKTRVRVCVGVCVCVCVQCQFLR